MFFGLSLESGRDSEKPRKEKKKKTLLNRKNQVFQTPLNLMRRQNSQMIEASHDHSSQPEQGGSYQMVHHNNKLFSTSMLNSKQVPSKHNTSLSTSNLHSLNPIPMPIPKESHRPSKATSDNRMGMGMTSGNPRGMTSGKQMRSSRRRSQGGEFIIGLCENRNQELGMAALNEATGEVRLCQYSDKVTYLHTMSLLLQCQPKVLIMAETMQNNLLTTKLQEAFPECRLIREKRGLFNETQGLAIYNDSQHQQGLHSQDSLYLALASLNALISHLNAKGECQIRSRSLVVKVHILEHVLVIDWQSVLQLDLIINHRDYSTKHTLARRFQCLTRGGQRMLRANLIQPPCRIPVISVRQQAVQHLLDNPQLVVCLAQEVQKYKMIDNITSKFIYTPQEEKSTWVKTYVGSIHVLVVVLHNVGLLGECLEQAQGEFFRLARTTLTHPNIVSLKAALSKIIDTQALLDCAKQKEAFLFALIQPRQNEFHINKLAYCQLNDSIYEHYQEVRQVLVSGLGLSQVQFMFTHLKGYCFCIRLDRDIKPSQIQECVPHPLVQLDHKAKVIRFVTQPLLSLNQRLLHKYDDLVMSCSPEIFQIIQIVQDNIEVLFNINSVVSELDMLMSFCKVVDSTKMSMTQPIFNTEFKCLLFQDMMDLHSNISPYQENQVFCSELNSMTILLGQASSGKSAYQKAIAVNVILAHIGCHVPARLAVLNPISLLLTKFQIHDCIEKNESSLQVELSTLANIQMNLAQNRSDSHLLVLVDNLITCSSHQENLAMNMFFLEGLLKNQSGFIFASTNDTEIMQFKNLYKQVYFLYSNSNFQFEQTYHRLGDFEAILRECGYDKAFLDEYGRHLPNNHHHLDQHYLDSKFIDNCLHKSIALLKQLIQINATSHDPQVRRQAQQQLANKYNIH